MAIQLLHDAAANPQTLVVAKASSARTKGDPVYLDMDGNGLIDMSLVDDTLVHQLAVAASDIASGSWGQYVIAGEVDMTVASASYTAGHAIKVLDGAVASTGGAFNAGGVQGEASNEPGVIKTGGTTVTSITVVLHGGKFTATT